MKTQRIRWCLEYLDELNSESQFAHNTDLYHHLCNARIELENIEASPLNDSTAVDNGWIDTLDNLMFFETVPEDMKGQIEEMINYFKSREG